MTSTQNADRHRPKRQHRLSVKWGKFKATGDGLGVFALVLLYATPALFAPLVKVFLG
jgi:hypothetical protein